MRCNRGELVLVPFPFTDLSITKRRPALVVSPNDFNKRQEDLILLAVTSQIPRFSHELDIALDQGDMAVGRIPKRSLIKLSKIFTVHHGLIVKRVGKVHDKKLQEVLTGLRKLFT